MVPCRPYHGLPQDLKHDFLSDWSATCVRINITSSLLPINMLVSIRPILNACLLRSYRLVTVLAGSEQSQVSHLAVTLAMCNALTRHALLQAAVQPCTYREVSLWWIKRLCVVVLHLHWDTAGGRAGLKHVRGPFRCSQCAQSSYEPPSQASHQAIHSIFGHGLYNRRRCSYACRLGVHLGYQQRTSKCCAC